MLLLHISDIHFRAPDCLNPDTDPERPYRTRLIQDVQTQTQTLGTVGAILVGGDIAFKGDPKEYEAALVWIRELADACGCPMGRIFVVPGNHDVDRRIIIGTPAVRNAQRAIAQAATNMRERELRTQFGDPETGRALLMPLAAYNDFAKLFSCQIYSPDHLYWKQDLPLEKGMHLRLHGLTSILLSGAGGNDDTRESLYLSPLQTVLDPVDDVVNLVLIHHPPDWLLDQEDANDAICGRATLHLFGHKHRQRINHDHDYIRYSAGAVNPDRNEPGWQPGYNLIQLHVRGDGGARVLAVESHLLQWQTNPDRFRPILTKQGSAAFCHQISIPGRTAIIHRDKRENSIGGVEPASGNTDVEAAMSDEGTRNLVFRFWNLTMSQRREIAQGLGLIEESEMSLPEPERYGRALLRAGERQLLDKLAQEILNRETH